MIWLDYEVELDLIELSFHKSREYLIFRLQLPLLLLYLLKLLLLDCFEFFLLPLLQLGCDLVPLSIKS